MHSCQILQLGQVIFDNSFSSVCDAHTITSKVTDTDTKCVFPPPEGHLPHLQTPSLPLFPSILNVGISIRIRMMTKTNVLLPSPPQLFNKPFHKQHGLANIPDQIRRSTLQYRINTPDFETSNHEYQRSNLKGHRPGHQAFPQSPQDAKE